jgi:hypothetical protein
MRRLLKFNEAKKLKSIKKDLNNIQDIKKIWQEFEDEQACDFDHFWNKILNYSNDYQNAFHRNSNNTHIEYTYELVYRGSESIYNRSDGTGGRPTPNDEVWGRRMGYIKAYVNTGGYSGGSCWDDEDNYARPYETGYSIDSEDLTICIDHILTSIIGTNHPFVKIPDLIKKLEVSGLIQEDCWTNYEYYGNSDDYNGYYITLWDLYVFLSKNHAL